MQKNSKSEFLQGALNIQDVAALLLFHS